MKLNIVLIFCLLGGTSAWILFPSLPINGIHHEEGTTDQSFEISEETFGSTEKPMAISNSGEVEATTSPNFEAHMKIGAKMGPNQSTDVTDVSDKPEVTHPLMTDSYYEAYEASSEEMDHDDKPGPATDGIQPEVIMSTATVVSENKDIEATLKPLITTTAQPGDEKSESNAEAQTSIIATDTGKVKIVVESPPSSDSESAAFSVTDKAVTDYEVADKAARTLFTKILIGHLNPEVHPSNEPGDVVTIKPNTEASPEINIVSDPTLAPHTSESAKSDAEAPKATSKSFVGIDVDILSAEAPLEFVEPKSETDSVIDIEFGIGTPFHPRIGTVIRKGFWPTPGAQTKNLA